MDRLTLRFPPQLESEFQQEHFRKSLRAVRLVLGIGTVIYGAIFIPIDYLFLPPEAFRTVTAIRIPTGLLLGGLLAFTFAAAFERWWQMSIAVAVLAVALSVSLMGAFSPPGSHIAYSLAPAFLLYLMVTFTVGRLRLLYATVTGLALLTIYNVATLWIGNVPFPALLVNNMLMFSAVLLGVTAAYLLEHYIRSDYLSARLLETERADLKQANDLLERRNAELARSREQVVRSARRTELVFLALTDALLGTVLDDKYRVEEKIGSGSFGTVYRGTHLQLGTPVAIKVLRPYQGQDDVGVLDRLRQEGISAWRLRHPNVVAVLDFAVASDAVAYLVMELLVGRSLAEELQASTPMTLARAAEVMEPVCSALAEAHAHGVIHRDIKPSNVFLHQGASGEVVKIIDLGIAKVLDDDLTPGSDRRTATGLFLGTPAYFAPERFESGAYSGAVDVYSVGVMLYEMLTGNLPFPAGTGDWRTALMRLAHQPPPLGTIVPGIPESLADAVLRALSVDPQDRPTAAELREVLAAARGAPPLLSYRGLPK